MLDDRASRKSSKSAHLSPLAVGLGIYLPTSATLMVRRRRVRRLRSTTVAPSAARKPEARKQLGVLLASGMIVGEGLIGVLIAAIVAFSGKNYPLALVGDDFGNAAIWIGGVVFVAAVFALYRWVERLDRQRWA